MKKEHWIILGVVAIGAYAYYRHKTKPTKSTVTETVITEETDEEPMSSVTGVTKLYPGQCVQGKEAQCATLCAKSGGTLQNGYCVEGFRGRNRGGVQRVVNRRA